MAQSQRLRAASLSVLPFMLAMRRPAIELPAVSSTPPAEANVIVGCHRNPVMENAGLISTVPYEAGWSQNARSSTLPPQWGFGDVPSKFNIFYASLKRDGVRSTYPTGIRMPPFLPGTESFSLTQTLSHGSTQLGSPSWTQSITRVRVLKFRDFIVYLRPTEHTHAHFNSGMKFHPSWFHSLI